MSNSAHVASYLAHSAHVHPWHGYITGMRKGMRALTAILVPYVCTFCSSHACRMRDVLSGSASAFLRT